MKQSYKHIACVSIFIYSLAPATPVNPQPGQNIWNITAAIGTELDQLTISDAATCTTLNSEIDLLSNLITSDFVATWTVLQSIDNTEVIISSKLDALISGCGITALTVNSSGTTVAASGSYCLTSDVALSAGNTIAITASNVMLDLNGHTISGGLNGLTISGNEVTVQNGTLKNATSSGIVLTGSRCIVSNCLIVGCANGMNLISTSNNTITDCRAINCTSTGFNLTSCTNNVLQSCRAINTGASGTSYGFITSSGMGNQFLECISEGTSSTGNNTVAGFTFYLESNSIISQSNVNYTMGLNTSNLYGIFLPDYCFTYSALETISTATYNSGNTVQAIDWLQLDSDNYMVMVGTDVASGNIKVVNFDAGELIFDNYPTATFRTPSILQVGVEWTTSGTRNLFASVGANGAGIAAQVFAFDSVNKTLTRLATFNNTNAFRGVSWLTIGTQKYLGLGGQTGGPSNAVLRVLEFNLNTNSLTTLTTATFTPTPAANANTVDWLTAGGQYYLAFGTEANASAAEVGVVRFNTSLLRLESLPLATFEKGINVASVQWLTSGTNTYLAFGSSNVSGAEVGVLQFDVTNASLSLLTSATFDNLANVTSVNWYTCGANNYLAVGGANPPDTYEVRILRFNETLHLLETITGAVFDNGAQVNSVKWLTVNSVAYLGVGSNPNGTISAQVLEFVGNVSIGNVIQNNIVTNTINGVGYALDVDNNMLIDNIAFNNDTNYSLAGTTYNINNRP